MKIYNKYVITRTAKSNMKMCAPGKAPSDCGKILGEYGVKELFFSMPSTGTLKKCFYTLYWILKYRYTIKNKSIVFIQYPIAPRLVRLLTWRKNIYIVTCWRN